jgi:cytochrome c peroxidase
MKKCVFIISAVIILLFMQAMITKNEPSNKQELGKLLFFDPILSSDSTISCASCHKPQFAFADSSATSRGVGGVQGSRNTPSAMNVALQNFSSGMVVQKAWKNRHWLQSNTRMK